MLIILLSLIVSVIAIIVLFKAGPDLFIFQFIEKIPAKNIFSGGRSVFVANTEKRSGKGVI